MNLKYYLRGLGLGLIVAAVIMGAALGGSKEKLSNEEIIIRAKELGMIENQVLSQYEDTALSQDTLQQDDALKNEDSSKEAEAVPVPEDALPEEEIAPDKELETEADAEGNQPEGMTENTPEEESNPDLPEETNTQETAAAAIRFTISNGDGSHKVSQRLAEAGIVQSAQEFDQFLIKNGYDKKIEASEFEIPANADYETIAKIITGR